MPPSTNTPEVIHLRDYRPPNHLIDSIALKFVLEAGQTTVTADVRGYRNPAAGSGDLPLVLHGRDQEILSFQVNGSALNAADWAHDDEVLQLADPGASFHYQVVSRFDPAANTALEGLYVSHGMYCTQCEAEGFRRITYFPDRPDVMTTFQVRIEADKALYPKLLSNGNLTAEGDLDDGRHFAEWHDPFAKPAYLFALVAGDLDHLDDQFTTASGRTVALQIFVEKGEVAKARYAMDALKRSMAWDEETFGLEYDLDKFMIVAVSHFNMGAMENKGLNIFNSAYILADITTATDTDFENIEAVVAHEYFHNWTGNRVTCRDWFQLSLKEGLTVYRDQEFSSDMGSRAVNRIQSVERLRRAQFPEDAGPMAHPVRPDSYIEINNFYTLTVYEKGAEVVRMIATLLGRDGFRKGMDLYISRHDGQAVTTDDFVACMADANGRDLSQFKRWYDQAGTPQLTVQLRHDAARQTASLRVTQALAATPGQEIKVPMHIPLAVGLIGPDGKDLPMVLMDDAQPSPAPAGTTRVLDVTQTQQEFTFTGIAQPPIASLLRDFSAPVRLNIDRSVDDLAFLMAHDSDPVARWDAGQELALRVLVDLAAGRPAATEPLIAAIGAILEDAQIDAGFRARAIVLPAAIEIGDALPVYDVDAVDTARRRLRQQIGVALSAPLKQLYPAMRDAYPADDLSAPAMASRALANGALGYLVASGSDEAIDLAAEAAKVDGTMTNVLAALEALSAVDCPQRRAALNAFHDRWENVELVFNKWLALEAGSPLPGVLGRVEELLQHRRFDAGNPNRVRALIGAFVRSNPVYFHAADGSGYAFLTKQVLSLDPKNPQLAARLTGALARWRRFDKGRQKHMQAALTEIMATDGLSRDSFEVASKALA